MGCEKLCATEDSEIAVVERSEVSIIGQYVQSMMAHAVRVKIRAESITCGGGLRVGGECVGVDIRIGASGTRNEFPSVNREYQQKDRERLRMHAIGHAPSSPCEGLVLLLNGPPLHTCYRGG
jgi:hypothetical protein